jgi:hypothetical protein
LAIFCFLARGFCNPVTGALCDEDTAVYRILVDNSARNGHPAAQFHKDKAMGNRKTSGLTKRGRIWHLNKQFRGVRIRGSAATTILTEAVELLASRIEGIRRSQLYGVRPLWTFREAAQKYLKENQHKKSVSDDERHLAMLDPFIGDLLLSRVYMEALRPFIEKRDKDGVKTKTINLSLEIVRRILRLAAEEWRDKQGATWLVLAAA